MPSGGCVVFGGARGVGRAIADRLFLTGPVVVVDADPAADELLAGSGFTVVVGDPADPRTASRALEALGPASLAGWVTCGPPQRDASGADDDVVGRVLAELAPAVVGTAAAVARFTEQGTGGAIVTVASLRALRPVPGALAAGVAAAAVQGLARGAAVDHAAERIRVNVVAVGDVEAEQPAVETDQDHDPVEALRAVGRLHPLGRAALPREVAEAVAFLLSDAASFVTGAVLPVDGGRSVYDPDPAEGTAV